MEEVLQNTPLFSKLSGAEIKDIAQFFREKHLQKGSIFISQDDLSDELYVIVWGTVKIYRVSEEGEEINLSVRSSGEVIGEMAFLEQKPRSAYAEVISDDSLILILERADFEVIIQKYHSVSLMMMKELASRLRTANEHLEDMISRNLHDRALKTIQTLTRFFQSGEIEMSQEELAEIIGATRSRVTEVLNSLEDEGKISIEHKKIKLLSKGVN